MTGARCRPGAYGLCAHETERDPHEEILPLEQRIEELMPRSKTAASSFWLRAQHLLAERAFLPRRSSVPSPSIPAYWWRRSPRFSGHYRMGFERQRREGSTKGLPQLRQIWQP
jgi:hypothetical protein